MASSQEITYSESTSILMRFESGWQTGLGHIVDSSAGRTLEKA